MNHHDFTAERMAIIRHAHTYLYYSGLIRPSQYLYSLTLHNAKHAYRVLTHSIILASKINLTNYETDVLCTAAVYHDIGRINDGVDASHGFRSWLKFAHNFCPKDISEEKRNAIKALIVNHCLEYHSMCDFGDALSQNKRLLLILKDADALDRVRNNKLNLQYLHVEESFLLVPFATSLCDNEREFHESIIKIVGGSYVYKTDDGIFS